jgi:hypothetical protein
MRPTGLVLATGRDLLIESLEQSYIYAFVLEGVPTRSINDGMVERAVEAARRRDRVEPFLIDPAQRRLGPNAGAVGSRDERVALPAVCCVARLSSIRPARDPAMNRSKLTVLWYQDDYAFPLSAHAAQAIRAIDWETLAHDEFYD